MRDDELEAGASRKAEADEYDARASEDRQTDMLPKESVAGRSGRGGGRCGQSAPTCGAAPEELTKTCAAQSRVKWGPSGFWGGAGVKIGWPERSSAPAAFSPDKKVPPPPTPSFLSRSKQDRPTKQHRTTLHHGASPPFSPTGRSSCVLLGAVVCSWKEGQGGGGGSGGHLHPPPRSSELDDTRTWWPGLA